MSIIIRTRDNTRIATLESVISCTTQEKLSTVRTLSFETLLEGEIEQLSDHTNYVVEYENDFYDVTKMKKSLSGGLYKIKVDCEHVSYRLSSASVTDFSMTGTPREILIQLLRGTQFTVGQIEPTAAVTFSVKDTSSVRAAILGFCNAFGWEAEFAEYSVRVKLHRGSSVRKELVDRNVVAISKSVDVTEDSRSYSCTVRAPENITLGDEVHFLFTKLGIDENVRVVGIKRTPFTSKDVELEVDNYEPTIEAQFNQIQTSMVAKGEKCYGVCITSEDGLEITRADGQAAIKMNADEFSMKAADSQGVLQNRIFFDPQTGEYKFVGTVKIDGGEINIGNNFRVDQNGNAYLAGDATIYGGKYYAGDPSTSQGFSQMTADGFEVYNRDTDIKLRFGYTTQGEDYPFIQLGSGSGVSTHFGLVKKFSDGLWIGNSEPSDESGTFTAKTGYNGIFFRFTDNTAYIVQNTTMKNIYTGAAIAKFG